MTKTIRLSEWVTPGDTAIPGMTSLEDGDLQHSRCIGPISKGDIEPNHPSEINPNSDSRSRSDGRSRRFVQYRVDQSHGQRRPRSLHRSRSKVIIPRANYYVMLNCVTNYCKMCGAREVILYFYVIFFILIPSGPR